MDDGTVECTIDLRWAGLALAAGVGPAGDELAACLERFLTATADERTLVRARAALALWHGFRGPEPAGTSIGDPWTGLTAVDHDPARCKPEEMTAALGAPASSRPEP